MNPFRARRMSDGRIEVSWDRGVGHGDDCRVLTPAQAKGLMAQLAMALSKEGAEIVAAGSIAAKAADLWDAVKESGLLTPQGARRRG